MNNQHKTELDFFSLFEMTPDLVCIAGKEGYFIKVNNAVIEKLGYTEKELMAKPISHFIHPDDKEATSRTRTELLNGKALINFQNRYITKIGEIIWLVWTSIYLSDREIVFAIAKDVTARKRIEQEVEEKYKKYKSLATHFKSNIEKDRKYLAMELHEELAQLTAVIKMNMHWLSENAPELTSNSRKRVDHALAVSDLLINAMNRITYSISPQMLEDFGLMETLEWLCEEFSTLNGIPCLFKSGFKADGLPPAIQLDFFRICQEALRNVMYHAHAKLVMVNLDIINDQYCLTITDDGRGFNMAEQKEVSGLDDMKKRAAFINGNLTVTSEIQKGTRVCFTLPAT